MPFIQHNKYYLISLFFYLMITITQAAYGQRDNLRFYHLSKNEGLPSNIITGIEKDNYGFIWIGTSEGLCRFDGKDIKIFDHNSNDAHTIPNNQIRALKKDPNGNLWLATDDWLSYYNIALNKFYHYTPSDSIKKTAFNNISSINSIVSDKNGNLWFAQNSPGLHYFNIKTKTYHTLTPNTKEQKHFYQIIKVDSKGFLWFLSQQTKQLFNSSCVLLYRSF